VAGDKKDYAGEIANILATPPAFKLVSLVALGYPDQKSEKEKRPLSEVLHWERF
jgi:nitroreductase